MSGSDKEKQNLADLERWEATLPNPPTFFDVAATGNTNLLGAYVLRAFRAAAKKAVEQTRRAERVRAAVVDAFSGDKTAAEAFLRKPHPALEDRTPLETAVQSEAGADIVLRLACRRDDSE